MWHLARSTVSCPIGSEPSEQCSTLRSAPQISVAPSESTEHSDSVAPCTVHLGIPSIQESPNGPYTMTAEGAQPAPHDDTPLLPCRDEGDLTIEDLPGSSDPRPGPVVDSIDPMHV